MKHYLVAVATILFISMNVHAQDGRSELSEKFVALLRFDEQFNKYQEQCVATQSSVSPEALVARNENYFSGIRPGHPKWPAVVAAYGKYFREACSRPTKSEFIQELSRSYAKALTSKQLRDSIAFYSSDTGRALIAAHKLATGAVYESWTRINSNYLADLTTDFYREISAISGNR